MSTILALDYGRRRIGLAVADPTATLATPLGCHDARHDGPVRDHLARLLAEHDVTELVVGLPLTADGRRGELALAAERFADRLREWFGLPVHLVDERYTTREAAGLLRAGGHRRRPRGDRDAAAAALILQQFLDGRRREERP